MTPRRIALAVIALLCILLAWLGIATARTGVVFRSLERQGVPMIYVAPRTAAKVPGVLIAHGFAGSKQLMLGYAHVLAHGGYAVLVWDFSGHGSNPQPFAGERLGQNLDLASQALLEQPEVDSTRLALLGHSMGTGVVMRAGIEACDRFAATVAVSPTGAPVTPALPRNLQLQAGSGEPRFVQRARTLLQAAGGENTALGTGQGRSLVIVPNVEHITILFSSLSHQAALNWFNQTFGPSVTSSYQDRRMAWYALHLLAWLGLCGAIAPYLQLPASARPLAAKWPLRAWGGLLIAPGVGAIALAVTSQIQDLPALGGVMVGGALGLWFLIAGSAWLGILAHLPRLGLRAVGVGLVLFALLWIAFGAMAQEVWLQWWLIPARFKLWPLLSLVCLPWFLATGIVQQGLGVGQRFLWWLGQSVVLIGGLLLTLSWVPQLGFLFLLLPVFPLILAILSFVAAQSNEAWSSAIGSALFFGWVLAVAFPLAG